jgi:SAM-dependent methyltransferase
MAIPMNSMPSIKPANLTRRSKSFVKKFAREGRYHLIPVYWLLRLSDFAREGMKHSGSYRFADHMYRGIPSGRGWLGRWIDGALLNLPATRSMRQRCFESRDAMQQAFAAHRLAKPAEPFRVLTVPCGLPRDVRDFASRVAANDPAAAAMIAYTGMDLDPEVIGAARAFLAGSAVQEPDLRVGNALEASAYPAKAPHFIASTGLGEFLLDSELLRFYSNVFAALAPGGTFFTSAAAPDGRTNAVLQAFELDAQYRTTADLERLLAQQPWESVEITRDAIGLQTFVRVRKGTNLRNISQEFNPRTTV